VRRKLVVLMAAMLLVGVVAVAQYHYAFYYDATSGHDLEINLINPLDIPNQLTMTVHDAYGGELWSVSDELAPTQAGYVRVGESLPASNYPWGVVTVDSAYQLLIGLEYMQDGELVSIDTISSEVPVLDPSEPFWLGAYYNQVGDSATGFIVMNPWSTTASCSVAVYNSNGGQVYTQDFVLGPFEAEYVPLESAVGTGNLLWGLLDVQMQDRSVVLAVEYRGRGCSGLEIDNVTEFYY
jgi:hypothetical protein